MQILKNNLENNANNIQKKDKKESDTLQNEFLKKSAYSALTVTQEKETVNARILIPEIKNAKNAIMKLFYSASKKSRSNIRLTSSEMWIFDNIYLYDEKCTLLINELKRLKKLPSSKVPAAAFSYNILPLYFLAFYNYITETDCKIESASVDIFINSAELQKRHSLCYADYYSFGTLFMAAVMIRLGKLCEKASGNANSESFAESIGKMTNGLRFLSDYSPEKSIESCPAEQILKLDPSGDYINMTEETKNIYRDRVIKLAKKNGISEEEFAASILEKARFAENIREKHIGFYLYPKKRKSLCIVYFASILSLTAITMFFLIKLNPFSLIVLFPVYELAKQLTDKCFSYFVPSYPLPRLKTKELPDNAGVMAIITTVLTPTAVNELCTKLEDIYHSCGMKNIYFAVLADFPESEKQSTSVDSAVFTEINDRISALNLKYGKSFFLFVRSRTYSITESKFMGYERKRGAIGSLCKYLSKNTGQDFMECNNLPDSSVCQKIKFVLTLDSDTNIPPDIIKKLAGIMLHPLNKPEIDLKKGVVTNGYGILQPAVSTELEAASKTLFSNIMNGNGGFEIYSFSGFDTYQSIFGEGTFCGKGIFDKNAFLACLENEELAFPENTVLSHDILEGARLSAANITDLHFTDGFPGNSVSYLKRHHRWVRGDTQNLLFLKKYIPTKSGNLIKNNISPLSKYKLFDNVRRASLPAFAFRGIIISCFLQPVESALILLFSLLYIMFGFISTAASQIADISIRCAARKYFSKNAIPGIILSFYRCILEISMLPSLAITSISAISVSLYRTFISKRKMLEWTTASASEKAVSDSLFYYIRKHMFSAVSGAAIYIFSKYAAIKLIGLMWFVFPVVSYFLGKKRNEKKNVLKPEQKKLITEYSKDMWKYFENAVSSKSNFLPVDNIQLYPDTRKSEKTSPTNIGLYLISVLAARDFKIIDTETMYKRLSETIATIDTMKKWNGHLYNWYSTKDLSVISPVVVSSVDTGNYIACLICLKEGLREYVNEKSELVELIYKIESFIECTELEKLYDRNKKLFHIDVNLSDENIPIYSTNHFDMLASEARTLSYIATAKKAADISHYTRLSRPLIKYSDRIGIASWTGSAFEYFMPSLFIPTYKGSLLYEALRFSMYRQKARCAVTNHGKVFGISESGYHAFDSDMNYQYKAFGIPELAYKPGLEKDLVISPYSTFLMMPFDIKSALENLKRMKADNSYGIYGFYEAYDFTASHCLTPQHVKSYMSHHMGMSIVASANTVFDNIFVKRFMRDTKMRCIKELLQEKIPIDCPVKSILPKIK